jgi:opacity protein-like surface antigen
VAIGGGGTSFNDLGKRSTGSFEFDPGYLAEASLGYDLGNLRVEGEAHYLATEIDQFSMGATTLNSTGDLQAGGGMLNLYYDFENHSPYTPYVGGGAGLEYVEIDDIIVGGVGLGGRRGAVLGWQASGGFSYRINRGYGVGLGYRFTVFEGEIDTEAHRILLSARRYF